MRSSLDSRTRVNLVAAGFGAAALVVQTEYLRSVLVLAAGGALAVGVALAGWLGWIALGALAGGRLSARHRAPVGWVLCCAALALPASLFPSLLLAGARLWSGVPAGELLPLGAVARWSLLACAPPALLVGISFPLLARLAARDQLAYPSGPALFIGGLWGAEAAGAFLAGLLFTWLLAGRTGPVFNTAVFGALPAALWLASGLLTSRPRGRWAALAPAALVLAVPLASLLAVPALDRGLERLYWQGLGCPGTELSSRWTRYSRVTLAELSGQRTLYENGQPLVSFPDPYGAALQAALLLSQHPGPRRALVVGPAAGGLAQALLAAGLEQVSAVHPDRMEERLLIDNLPQQLRSPLSRGYSYLAEDARALLARRRHSAAWDLVFLNLDGPSQLVSARLYTPAFFRQVRLAFGDQPGLLALRLPIGANFSSPARLDQAASVLAALAGQFDRLALALTDSECYLFAGDSVLSAGDQTRLISRLAQYEGRVPGLSRWLVPMLYDPDRAANLAEALNARGHGLRLHTDTTPVAWLHHLRFWARLARPAGELRQGPGPLERLLTTATGPGFRIAALWPALLLSLAFFLTWLLAWRTGRPRTALRWIAAASIAATGFAAMGATISLIYLCQLVFGSLFHQLAMITASFMLALALGSWWASRRAIPEPAGGKAVARLAFLASVAVSLPALALPLLERCYGLPGAFGAVLSHGLFYLLVAAVGLFSGALFPWLAAVHGWAREDRRTEATAAALDCADHLGAALGALVVGLIALPALGFGTVCSGLALVMILVAVFWLALPELGRDLRH